MDERTDGDKDGPIKALLRAFAEIDHERKQDQEMGEEAYMSVKPEQEWGRCDTEDRESSTENPILHEHPGQLPCKHSLKHETDQDPEAEILKNIGQQAGKRLECQRQERQRVRIDDGIAELQSELRVRPERKCPIGVSEEQPAQIVGPRVVGLNPRYVLRVNDGWRCNQNEE